MSQLIVIVIALVPVLGFLGLLLLMDSYKLLSMSWLLRALAAGVAAALAALLVNLGLSREIQMPDLVLKRYAAPLVEEALKAIFVVYVVRTARAGFLVDAAIFGFAVGAGFALVENLYYMRALGEASLWLWIVRGLGTAVMHGSTTAIFATLAKGLTERRGATSFFWFFPGLVAAVGIHSTYNHTASLVATAVLLALLPVVVIFVFEQSERATRNWLGSGFDDDTQLLEVLVSGEIRHTRVGHYLQTLRERFPGPVVGDMLCLLQIHLELSMRAKGILMAREAGIEVPVGEDVRPKLDELRYLRKSIGKTGMLAIQPFLGTSPRELWQLFVLQR